MAAAEPHRRAGREHEAIRVLESVLLLDRRNDVAKRTLRELRAAQAKARRRGAWARLIRLVLGPPLRSRKGSDAHGCD
jgi:hypothetical protein